MLLFHCIVKSENAICRFRKNNLSVFYIMRERLKIPNLQVINMNGFEIERKFLILYPNLEILKYKYDVDSTEIVQTYFSDDFSSRVRKRGHDGNYVYTMTVKKSITDVVRTEEEKILSEDEYNRILSDNCFSLKTIIKTRHCFQYENQLVEIDVYPFWNDKAILEIEMTSEDSPYYIPKEISVIREVTSETRYRNAVIAKTTADELAKYD